MIRVQNKPVHLLLAAAALAVLLTPFVGAERAAAGPSVKKQVRTLKQQVRVLQRQLEDVSKQPGPQGPEGPPGPATGPAGGDLTGTYPNPVIGPAAVGSAELADDSVGATEIADAAVGTEGLADDAVVGAKIQSGAVGSSEIAERGVGEDDIQTNTVGASELKSLTTATSSGTDLDAGEAGIASVTCPGNRMVVGGGYGWRYNASNTIVHSRPSEIAPHTTWEVRGYVPAGSNTLYAWANCLER